MTYPYGTKGAPVVGNGLGGLPRRAVAAAAAVAAGPRLFERVGNFTQVNTSVFSGGGPVSWGRKIGVNEGKMFFKLTRIDGGGNTNYTLSGASYSNSGVTGALSESNFGTSASVWNEISFSNSWTSGDSAFFYDRPNNQIVRISAPSTSIVRTTVKTSAIPLTSTFTVGGNSYSVIDTGTCKYAGDNTPGNGVDHTAAQALSNGGVLLVRFVTNNATSTIQLGGFVFDSSWNLVRSFPIRTVFSGASNSDRFMLMLPVSGSTDLFSVFSVCGGGGTSIAGSCATFDWTTGTTTASSNINTFSVSAASWLQTTTYLHTASSLQFFFNDAGAGSPLTRRTVFQINSNFSVINAVNVSHNVIANPQLPRLPTFRYYDPEFGDYYSSDSGGSDPASFQPFIPSFGSGFFNTALPTLQEVAMLNYSSATGPGSICGLSAKGITAMETDSTSIADTLGAGPTPLARVGSNSYVGLYYDQQTSVPAFLFRAQLMRTT